MKGREVSPIALFVYKRLYHTEKTIEALKQNFLASDTELFIFSDGPKEAGDSKEVELVRSYLDNIQGFKKIEIIKSNQNKGLARSIIEGVTSIIEKKGKVIVIEDDIQTSKNFLDFLNSALDFYSDDPSIFQISGYRPPISISAKNEKDVFFVPRICSWGWAIWKDRWNQIDWTLKDMDILLKNRQSRSLFSLAGKDKISVLIGAKSGINDVWAIIAEYSRFMRNNSLVVYPVISKAGNIGSDGTGTHGDKRNKFDVPLDTSESQDFKFNEETVMDTMETKEFEKFYSINWFNKLLTYYSYKFGLYKYLKRIKTLLKNA